MVDSEWQVATKRKKARSKSQIRRRDDNTRIFTSSIPMSVTPTEASIARMIHSVNNARRDILNHPKFYPNLISTLSYISKFLSTIQEIIIYGLGSLDQPGAVHIRHQLALGLLLSDHITALRDGSELHPTHTGIHTAAGCNPPAMYAFDPVFTLHDQAVLPLLGIRILDVNEHGRRLAAVPTLFFMPHCEAELTNNLIACNKDARTLGNVVIIGNSFELYRDRWSFTGKERVTREDVADMVQVLEDNLVEEKQIDESGYPVTAAFNDMSLHTFGHSE